MGTALNVGGHLMDGLEIAKGSIPGHSGVSIPGRRDGIGTTGLEDLTETGNDVMPRPAGIDIEIVSTSTADNGATATGVLTVEIEYLDASGDEQAVALTMNGTTAVNIGTFVYDIQWMHTVTVGSNTVAEGDIKVRDVSTGAIIYEQISAGGNQSLTARYKIPNGKTGYIICWHASAVGQKIDFRIRANVDRHSRALLPGVFNFQDAQVLEKAPSGCRLFSVPLKVPQLSTVKISAMSFVGAGDAGACFDIILVDN